MSRIMSHAGPTIVSRAARWLGGALLVPSLAAAQADTRPVVVVFTFTNSVIGAKNDFEGLTTGIQDVLITDLAANANALRAFEERRGLHGHVRFRRERTCSRCEGLAKSRVRELVSARDPFAHALHGFEGERGHFTCCVRARNLSGASKPVRRSCCCSCPEESMKTTVGTPTIA